jgi:dienelactone hydrolase
MLRMSSRRAMAIPATHGFFAADRPSYRAEAAADGHMRILTWLGRYLEG